MQHKKLRNDPSTYSNEGFYDRRNSLKGIYISLFLFIGLEYIAELKFDAIPSGLVFPLGFLLFWGFFYTYYKPNFLEEKLTGPKEWNLIQIPLSVLSFIALVIHIIGEEFLFLFKKEAPKKKKQLEEIRFDEDDYTAKPEADAFIHPPQNPPPSRLPLDIREALQSLGLSEQATWTEIHKRYRELAKKLHPDLHPDQTDFGEHFILVDKAYRRLESHKSRYFH
jgi:hypothetical protein